jgi:glutathione synthase/RimK-type ligase-like ATP-grasp enzyme
MTLEGRVLAEDEWLSFLLNTYVETSDRLWINSPEASIRANSKLHQLRLARSAGLEVPDTLVTNDPGGFRQFAEEHGPNVTVKRLTSIRRTPPGGKISTVLFTHRLASSEIDSIRPEAIALCPCILQSYIPKRSEYRAYVVGDRVLSCEILSQDDPATEVDWRHYPLRATESGSEVDPDRWKCRVASLPGTVEDQCRRVVRGLGLKYSAVDLIRTPDDRFVFVEANFGGSFLWIERMINLPVSNALADVLAGVVS